MSDSSSFNGSRCTVCGAMYRPGWLCDCVPKSPPAAQPAPDAVLCPHGRNRAEQNCYVCINAEGKTWKLTGNDQPLAMPTDEEQLVTNQGVDTTSPGPDDLVARLLEWYDPETARHDMHEAAARITQDRERIAQLTEQLANTNHATARLASIADKYKWQVRDTCTRAERAEADNAKLRRVVEAADAMRTMVLTSTTHTTANVAIVDFDAARAALEGEK